MRAPEKSIQHSSAPGTTPMASRDTGAASVASRREREVSGASFLTSALMTRVRSGSSCFGRFLPEQLLENADALVHMLFFQQEGRQETHNRILRGIEQHAFGEACIHDGTRRNFELNALNKSAATDADGCGALCHETFELLPQISTDPVDVLEQLFFFHDSQELKRDAAGQRAPAEGGAMLTGRDRVGKFFLRDEGPERQAGRNRLGDGDDVGSHAKRLEREKGAGAAEAALDLIEDECGAMPVGQGAALLEELF